MIEAETSRIGPVDIAVLTFDEAVAAVDDRIDAADGASVTFCNAHSVNLARDDRRLVDAYASSLVLNDGIGVDMARKLLYGAPFPANVNGSDFIPIFFERSRHELRLFLLGSRPGIAAQAGEIIAERYPRHRVVGVRDGYFKPEDEPALVEEIARSGANLLVIGMGQPRQEIFAARHADRIGMASMSVGAFLDFTSGAIPRAPNWLRTIRLEWLYRLGLEPKRMFNRYVLGNPRFLYGVLKDRKRNN
ncbi:WecB/TagA/CpsF family glycosyltransferase [Sphingomonas sp. T9W2]|uniref:WecB/TagA/CpsF family glycosyltransferase n=1 Tax=Sphingomonas sp. T9W2 TaxID=3143183 RepID=UPI0031F56B7C